MKVKIFRAFCIYIRAKPYIISRSLFLLPSLELIECSEYARRHEIKGKIEERKEVAENDTKTMYEKTMVQ